MRCGTGVRRAGWRDITVPAEESGAAARRLDFFLLHGNFFVTGEERHVCRSWDLTAGNGCLGVLVFCIREFFRDEGGLKEREVGKREFVERDGGDIASFRRAGGRERQVLGGVRTDDVVGRGKARGDRHETDLARLAQG